MTKVMLRRFSGWRECADCGTVNAAHKKHCDGCGAALYEAAQ